MRQDISRLRRNRALHFQIGLCISLLAAIFTLNFTVYPEEVVETTYELPVDDFDFEVARTAHQKPTPPPPPPEPRFENIKEVDDFPEIDAPEPSLKTEIEVPIEPNVVFKKKKALPPPPPPPPMPKPKVKEVWKIVEEMPRFGECEGLSNESERRTCSDKNILQYIHSKLKYPSLARENGVEGNVVVSFVIDEEGKFTKPKILRDIGAGCGDEVLRVLNEMPNWSPGKQRGRNVKVQFNVPIRFQLD